MSERSTIVSTEEGLRIRFDRVRVLVEEGPDAGLELVLQDQPVIIGRGEEAELRLSDPEVSRAHVTLQPSHKGWKVRDLGSASGTWVDGTEVEVAPLKAGSSLRVGRTVMVLKSGETEVRTAPREEPSFSGMVGGSPRMRQLFGLVERISELDLPVLLMGESGTGKERLARAVHEHSGRSAGPYEVVDCTLLEREHLRSELFGHVKGAFTGATGDRKGAFERAHGGTLFLDEVAELPLEIQPALLRILEEGEVRPLGGDRVARVRVRVVSATNKDLRALVQAGTFREDLFYRLSALEMEVPPLRERTGDVLRLARHHLPEGASLTPEAESALVTYPWPGNVRELRNVLQRAAGMARGAPITPADLALPAAGEVLMGSGPSTPGLAPQAAGAALATGDAGGARMTDYEAQAIRAALEACEGNRRQAAKRLGIARSTLYRKLKEYGME